MDINFTAAILFINMGKFESAVEHLEKAIAAEENKGSIDTAIEYTCVLGELLAKMGENDRAREEFGKVAEYCNRTNSLVKQKEIAEKFIIEYDGVPVPGEALSQKNDKEPWEEAVEKLHYSNNKPNTTQTSVFLQ